jgi:hypothetical protein
LTNADTPQKREPEKTKAREAQGLPGCGLFYLLVAVQFSIVCGSKTSAVAAPRASGQQQMQVLAATDFTLEEYRPHGVLSSEGPSAMTRTDACRARKG